MAYLNYIIVALLVSLSGVFSGLTLGLFSLNLTSLERKIKLGNKKAQKVYKVRKNGNLLLCTLLLGNVAVNSAMAIFLGSIASGLIAGIISTGLIVVFGEIIPQAVFSRYALTVGANTVWLVRIFIILMFPVAFPLSWVLDKALGKEFPTIWSKREIEEIIKLHEDSPESSIDADEERIILGALSYSEKRALDVMTPKTVVYHLDGATKVTGDLLNEIREKAFTRIPVFTDTPDNITGILFIKKLIGDTGASGGMIKDVCDDDMLCVKETIKLDKLLNHFILRKMHMAVVFDDYGIFKGIVTLEDVIEDILKVEIMDEADSIEDMRKLAKDKFKRTLIE